MRAVKGEMSYEVLHGTTDHEEYVLANGWTNTSFQTIGDISGGD